MPRLCIGIVGLGYVGLPIAVAFARRGISVVGFDIDGERVKKLSRYQDATGELSPDELRAAKTLHVTDDPSKLRDSNFIIVAVPTPVTAANKPDLSLIEQASQIVGQNLSKKAVVVYESTVYPGLTEEICVPIIEKYSGLKCGSDFKIGYSPERINPGDKEHSLDKIVKVVAGQDEAATKKIAEVYGLICDAGVYRAANIKTAEAAKVIENTQRDLNIALINELSLIFHRLGIDTQDVLATAATKWNFLQFSPGLVGGHCIGVDPYYLVHKAEELGYHPQVIAAGRRVNDYMPEFVAQEMVSGLIQAGKNIQQAKVLVLGLTFKENVKDIRNSKIGVTIARLKRLGITVYGFDPLISAKKIKHQFSIFVTKKLKGRFDGVIIAAPHAKFHGIENDIIKLFSKTAVVFDIKKSFPKLASNRNIIYKTL